MMSEQPTKKYGVSLWVANTPKESNALKDFMCWMRLNAPRVRFSHANQHTSLHTDLSITENLLLAAEEMTQYGSYHEKEAHLNERLEAEGLKILASWFKNPRRFTHELSVQEKTMASICFALLRPAEVTLVDLCGIELEPLCVAHLQKILEEKSQTRHITVRVSNSSLWEKFDHDQFENSSKGLKRKSA
ncbi:MAG: hypothetical protein K2P81_01205 [Bacteriovoracaceae bacterium]|nr:hypothetical protein [Bacteriovoracaceae bacterium]